jgi:TPR repeat protein
MKRPALILICISLLAATACDKRPEPVAQDGGALERLYQADLTRANEGETDAMMRIGRYHDNGLSENDRCAGMLATLCRIGTVSRWLAGTVVSPDRVQAYKWYALAGAHGYRGAQAAKQSLRSEMSPSEIEEGERLAAEWLALRGKLTHQRALGSGT